MEELGLHSKQIRKLLEHTSRHSHSPRSALAPESSNVAANSVPDTNTEVCSAASRLRSEYVSCILS